MELRWIAALALWTVLSGPVFSPVAPTPAAGPRAARQAPDSSEAEPHAPGGRAVPEAGESR